MTDVVSVPMPTNVFLNALVSGGKVYLQHKLTYSFNFDPDPSKQFPEWLPEERAAFKVAINEWGKVANISFTEKATGGDFVESKDPLHNALPADLVGEHDTPGSVTIDPNDGDAGPSLGFYDPAAPGWTASGLTKGGLGYALLVREIAHALGLAYPHDSGDGFGLFPGVSSANDVGDNGLNQGIFTIMSSNNGWDVLGTSPSNDYGWQSGSAFDIAALQYLYGAKAFATRDNTYNLGHVNGRPDALVCIWDTKGIDQFKYSGNYGCTIDLRAATLLNEDGGGGFVSYVNDAPTDSLDHWNAFTIAHNVVIENATGGGGDDHIMGNQAKNHLKGGLGQDTLIGAAGADRLTGGGGSDTFEFDDVADSGKTAKHRDHITDFEGGLDHIDLHNIADFSFIGRAAFSHVAGELRFSVMRSVVHQHVVFDTIVTGDLDGNGVADFSIQLNHHKSVTVDDFIL
jgi:Ca2+-binding RTX toxin-like protein